MPQTRCASTRPYRVFALAGLCVAFGVGVRVHAQAMATATRDLRMSVFAGATGTDTGLPGNPFDPKSSTGNNLGITAGYDLGFRTPLHRLHTALEIRGTYPFYNDNVDKQENVLAGLKIGPYYGRFRPYGDAFYGRGGISYSGFGYPSANQPVYYTSSFGNIFAGGGGVDVDLNEHFAVKFDVQIQRYSVPVTTSGHLLAKAGTVGLVYRFDFDHRVKLDKAGMPKGK